MASGAPRSGLVFPAPRSDREIDTFTDIRAALVAATKSENNGEAWTVGLGTISAVPSRAHSAKPVFPRRLLTRC